MSKIPKIIHQIWIGDKPRPSKLMDTWRDKNPDFEYIIWNEEELIKRNIKLICQSKIDDIEEINGKADIMRWELLEKFGGIFIDADSICIEPIDAELLSKKCFAGWEQENVRPGLVATGTMGFPKNHPLVSEAVKWILNNEVSKEKTNMLAWILVGPGLLTRMYNTGLYKDLHIFPSYTFLPIHLTGIEYTGHGKIYAFQEWGSTKKSYDNMNNTTLPSQFIRPVKENGVSILIPSFNTKSKYIQECLESIKLQEGYFNIELIWINDGSDELHTKLLKKHLENFEKTTRFINVVYCENTKNMGLGYTLNKGVNIASYELIIRMDSDDIMVKNRIITQVEFMNHNKDVMICGSQVMMFKDNINNITNTTNHKSITLNDYKKHPLHWFANHPSLCFRKEAIISVGNYNINISKNIEDFELLLRILKKYEYFHNLSDSLLYYRLHDNQLTHNGSKEGPQYWHKIRTQLIQEIIE
uniref:Glycosyltransferase 2-like domain-containing protein n=1 Tax=viral metagenome TaxID=1070528 RepID=A0A6C0ET18_9ZZZZ